MVETKLIDGKAIAAQLRERLKDQIARLPVGGKPGLAVVLVGEDPASQVYVRNKLRQTVEVGMQSFEHRMPAEVSEDQLLDLVRELNRDRQVHGILVQLPLPKHIDAQRILSEIDLDKDVDGFHPVNAGRLSLGLDGFVPCTPVGCNILLKQTLGDLAGRRAIIIGRSNIVGKPIAQLLLRENCTVVIAHSRTRDLADECRRADILVAAVGQPEFVKGDWIKVGATVLDVGINRVAFADGPKLVGDVAFNEAIGRAAYLSPVPGGVGPMTIACLLANTWKAYRATSQTLGPPIL
ncbi:bifunctional methylenetetrahydrofolate dehydrogenase/methenyltetrahydrofolate cyclohydrolase FolD [Bradyrhizobium sp. USDA 3650]